MLTVMVVSAGVVGALMLAGWVASVLLKDASIVDLLWGLGFVLVAWAAFAVGDGYTARKVLIVVMASLWGLRLSGYLTWRNWGKGEDFRYQRMRAHHGGRFPLISLLTVFGLQGVLMYVISLPLQVAQASETPSHLTWLDVAGLVAWGTGLAFETIGDWQLARFKANPADAGRVMDEGLWAYTRHPNYFGDALVWWGIFFVAASRPESLWVVVSPALMTFLLTRVSGVTLLERSLVKRREGYEEYIARTSSFIPWPPRRDAGAAARRSHG